MTDTPETDDLARGNHVVPTEFAQDLERQRNDARQAFAIATDQCVAAQSALRAARDTVHRLRKALQDIAALDTSQDASPQQCAAVLLAMNALDQ